MCHFLLKNLHLYWNFHRIFILNLSMYVTLKNKFVWRVIREWNTFNRRFKSFESETEFECKILKIIFIQYRFQAAFMLIFNIRELSLTFQSSLSSMWWDWINTFFHFTYFTQTWESKRSPVTFDGSYNPIKNRDFLKTTTILADDISSDFR